MNKLSLLITLATMMFSSNIAAQNNELPTNEKYAYIEVYFKEVKLLSIPPEINIFVDYGQECVVCNDGKNNSKDVKRIPTRLVDDENNAVVVHSVIGGFNYLTQLGWEYVDANDIEGLYHFILRKKVNKSDIGFYVDCNGVHIK